MASPTVENYLKALLNLADEGGEVAASALGRSLGVSSPSVNSMVRKLSQQGLVSYRKYQPLRLTNAGRRAAALVVRKHRLTEMFLVEKMGFGWEEVHTIAEQIEHVESPEFFARMDELMGYPTVDPHGSPIPDPDGKYTDPSYAALSECPVGRTVTLVGLKASSNELLHYLNERSINLRTELEVLGREPFDGTVRVRYDDAREAVLSKLVAEKLLVERT